MRVVVDASIAIKWAIDEPDAALARPIADLDLRAVDLIYPELANILWRKVRLGQVPLAYAAIAAAALRNMGIETRPAAEFFERALSLSLDLDHPAYDLFYVALALDLGLPFVTADARLIAQVRKVAPPWAATVVPLAAFTPA